MLSEAVKIYPGDVPSTYGFTHEKTNRKCQKLCEYVILSHNEMPSLGARAKKLR